MVTFGSKAFRSVHIDATKKVYTSIFGIGCLKRRSADQKKKKETSQWWASLSDPRGTNQLHIKKITCLTIFPVTCSLQPQGNDFF